MDCCYTCDFWKDELCEITDEYDDEDPNTFICESFEECLD